MLLHIPGVLSSDEVARYRQALAEAPWADGRATVGPQGAQVKRNEQLPADHPLARELGQLIVQRLSSHPQFVSAALPHRILPPLFNRYQGGDSYGLHVDGSVMAMGDGQRLRSDVSTTLFLCDTEDYEGGELVVMDTYGAHEVKLPAGDLILYPSTSLHKVEPVTRGARTCAFFWTQSLVRDTGQRAALYELDQTIQRLRAQLGDSAEVLQLTGHYHNLLRRWAEL